MKGGERGWKGVKGTKRKGIERDDEECREGGRNLISFIWPLVTTGNRKGALSSRLKELPKQLIARVKGERNLYAGLRFTVADSRGFKSRLLISSFKIY